MLQCLQKSFKWYIINLNISITIIHYGLSVNDFFFLIMSVLASKYPSVFTVLYHFRDPAVAHHLAAFSNWFSIFINYKIFIKFYRMPHSLCPSLIITNCIKSNGFNLKQKIITPSLSTLWLQVIFMLICMFFVAKVTFYPSNKW